MPFWDKLESDWNFTGEDYGGGIGSDKSHRYMKNKKAVLYIATDNTTQRVVGFKPFIESFKMDYKIVTEDEEIEALGRSVNSVINVGITYSIGLVMPATSINEARMNKRKLELLSKFLEKLTASTTGFTSVAGSAYTVKSHYLYLNNLIHNGEVTSGSRFTDNSTYDGEATYKELRKYACRGYITDVNYSVVVEDGFFEYDGGMFPKTYKTKITFIAFNDQHTNPSSDAIPRSATPSHYLVDAYKDCLGTTNKTLKYWPFGIQVKDSKKSSISVNDFGYNFLRNQGYGYDHHYTNSKNSYIWIFPANAGIKQATFNKESEDISNQRLLAFKPYLESLTFSRKNTKNEVFSSFRKSTFYGLPAGESEYDLSYNVISTNVNESIANHAKFQELLKMVSPGSVDISSAEPAKFVTPKDDSYIRILFSNLIYDQSRYSENPNIIGQNEPHPDTPGLKIGDIRKNVLKRDFTHSSYYRAARPFKVKNISYDPILDLGFYEYSNMLWPKAFKLKFSLIEFYSWKTITNSAHDFTDNVYKLEKGS